MRNDKVIHVELKHPYLGKQHYYFGSVKAIYQVIPKDIIGISLESLWSHFKNDEYVSRNCTIRKGILIRQKTNRFRNNG